MNKTESGSRALYNFDSLHEIMNPPLLPLPQDVKDRWIQALASGGYNQGMGQLCDLGNYCCLGVLAHIEYPDNSWRATDSYLTVAEDILDHEVQDILSNLNDAGCSFEDIAYVIQERL